MKENKPVVALAAGAVLQLFLGILYVWSVFVLPVSERFDWSLPAVKLTASFMLCFFVFGILIGGKLQVKITTQKTVLIGGLLFSFGVFASAFIPLQSPFLIYVSYGIMGGFGVGMAYNAVITSAQKSFPKKRGFATGISVCAFGFSTVVFAPLIEFLIKIIGLKSSFIILAAMFLAATLLLFKFITTPEESAASGAKPGLKNTQNLKKQYETGEILKTREFYLITLSLMLGTSVFFILNPSFKSLAADRGLSPQLATIMVMITGVANALGRLAAAALSDKIGTEKTAFIIISLTSVGVASLIFVSGIALIPVISVITFCYGGYTAIYPVITGDYFGLKNVGSNYGAIMIGFATSAMLFPILLGFIENMTLKFIVLAILSAAGASSILLLLGIKNKKIKEAV